jgi:two-component system, NarL family, nitrate/nitrite response regulator NarL
MHPENPRVRVLVVDDEPLFIQMVEALLARDGRVEVVGKAENGREAVALALSLVPDVILMDISMPIMDGVEAARLICSRDPSARILMLTGSSFSVDIDRSRKAGASGFVTKDRISSGLVDSILDLAKPS